MRSENYKKGMKTMIMIKRIIAMALAVIMIVALVGCGEKKRQPIQLTLSSEDSEAILAAAGIVLPDAETAAGAGTTIKYHYYYDDFHNYSEDELIQTGYWTFQQKYGGSVEWIETTWSDINNDLANLILSGNPPDFTRAWESCFPTLFINGLYATVDEYIDYSDPLWSGMKYFSDTFFSVNGKSYFFLTDVKNNSLMLYNRRVFDEYGFDDPAELYYNNEWTWDVMFDMAMDFTDPDEGRFAFNGWSTDSSFISSTGTYLILLDTETGKFYSNYDDPRIERAASVLTDINKNDLQYPHWNNGWTLNFGNEGGGMKEGLTLFALGQGYIIDELTSRSEEEERFGDMGDNEVMIVPVPRDPNGDGEYYIDSIPMGYCLINGARNPEGVALLAMCDRFKIIDPTVIRIDDKQKKEVLGWNDEMLDMWKHMYELAGSHNTIVQYGGLGDASDLAGSMIGFNNWKNPSSWAEMKESNKDALEYAIDVLNESLAGFDPDNAAAPG